MDSADAAVDRLCDPQAEVSAHYLISLRGKVIQMVDEDQRAWHAGAGEWAGQDDINSRSIGIELDNKGNHPFPEPQMAALEELLAAIMSRWSITPAGIIGHSDMSPGRKSDPGAHFDWSRLSLQGLAASAKPLSNPVDIALQTFATQACTLGYSADVAPATLLTVHRLRFAPWREGPVCAADFLSAEKI